MRKEVALAALLFCATLLAYSPALHGGLLWDDVEHVTKPALRSFDGLKRIWSDLGATQQYYPLLHSAFWLEHRLWGDSVLGYHLLNVTLHATAAILLLLVLRSLTLPGAWLAAFIFALHPVHVDTVAWISEQKNTLSAVFYLGSALAYLNFDKTRQKKFYWLGLALFVLALLSKTVAATLPAALLVVLWFRRNQLRWKQDIAPLLPWLALGAGAGLFTAWVERTYIGAAGSDFAMTLIERCLLAGRVIFFYAASLVWPSNLMFVYPRWAIDASQFWQYLFPLLAVGIAAALYRTRGRHRGLLAAFLIFAGTLFPVLGFLNVYPFRYSYVADHFQYLASLGMIAPAAAGLATLSMRLSARRQALGILLPASMVVILGALTWRHSHTYLDLETLYRETLARNPDAQVARHNLAVFLSAQPGRLLESVAEYEAAIKLNPNVAAVHNDYGVTLSKIPGRLPEAIAQFEWALRIDRSDAFAHTNLGNALAAVRGRLDEALAHFQSAVQAKSDYAEAHSGLAAVLAQMPDRLTEALSHAETAVALEPELASVHVNLGSILARLPNRQHEALTEFDRAIHLQPDNAELHYNKGLVLSQMPGRFSDAVAEHQAAFRLRPDYAEPHYGLGLAYRVANQPSNAIAEFRKAVQLNPDLAGAHFELALALASEGKELQEAISEFEHVLRLNPDMMPAHYNLALLLLKTQTRRNDAIHHFEESLRLEPDLPNVRELIQRLRSSP